MTGAIPEITRKLVRALEEVWMTDVARDYEENRLWTEHDISTSLAYHLRKRWERGPRPDEDMNDNKRLRIWLEVGFPKLWGTDRPKVDLVIARVDRSIRGATYGELKAVPYDPLVVAEVKYTGGASRFDKDAPKLRDIRDKISSAAPIFAYLNHTADTLRTTVYDELVKKMRGERIGLLFGDADNYKNWRSAFLEPYR